MNNNFTPSRRVEQIDGQYVVYVKPPKIVGDLPEQCVILSAEQYARYRQWRETGLMIQEALPELSPSQREVLMTGLDDATFAMFTEDMD